MGEACHRVFLLAGAECAVGAGGAVRVGGGRANGRLGASRAVWGAVSRAAMAATGGNHASFRV